MSIGIDIQRIRDIQAKGEARLPFVDPRLRDVILGLDGYSARFHDLYFIVSEAKELDGRWWRHASVHRRDKKMPTYEDLKTTKQLTMGDDLTAYQLFVPAEQHVNIHSVVLHLWACVDGAVTPDFTRGTGSI